MTPGARIAAAIEILDSINDGVAGEPALTRWARGHRFAGSGDRAAIRDHVFDVLRRRRSCGWLGGGDSGRQLMLGWAKSSETPVTDLFSGLGYAPETATEEELQDHPLAEAPLAVRLDCPDWLLARFETDLGAESGDILNSLRARAPQFLRVNALKGSVAAAQSMLLEERIETAVHALAPGALEITANPRRLRNSLAYSDGHVELQDAASQAVVDLLPIENGTEVLDFCAGGGGKSLAMVARGATVIAHDAHTDRMVDLPVRAERAGVTIPISDLDAISGQQFDLVACDAPCSGSGAWRRSPEAKWNLTKERLTELQDMQMNILTQAAEYVKVNGVLAYITCSLFQSENQSQTEKFLQQAPGFEQISEKQFSPLDGGDGFFVSLLTRVS